MRPRNPLRAYTFLAALCLSLATTPACSDSAAQGPKNVVLICLDTVRADHLGCYGYEARETTPALDALARESTVFLDTSATACWTKPSVPSIFTGLYPLQHGVYRGSARDEAGVHSDVLPERARTLAEVFQERGYATAAFVKNAQLRSGLGFEQGFDLYRDQAGDAREIRWRASDWLEGRDAARPFFLYLHVLDAHWPYHIPDESAARFADPEAVARFRSSDWRKLRDALNDGELQLTGEDLDELLALYDGALRYIDDQLGLLFAKLEREGLLDETIVCIVSDHGEEFLEHGRIGHGHGLYENLLQVPWILRIPGRESGRVEDPVSLVDLFPTLLAAAGIEAGDGLPGIDRLGPEARRRDVFAEHLEPSSYRQSSRHEGLKVIRRFDADPDAPVQLSASAFAGRWEVSMEWTGDGGLRATRLRRADPEDEGDPAELKGPIETVASGRVELNGIAVVYDDATKLYGETQTPGGEERVLAPGMLVKARGTLETDGTFRAERIKLYAAEDELERELRGPVTDVTASESGSGSLRVGGIGVRFDEETSIEGTKTVLPRAFVLDVCAANTEPSSSRLFDLESDPLEEQPVPLAAHARELLDRFDAWQAGLGGGCIWRVGERETLSATDVEALRAIGYAD